MAMPQEKECLGAEVFNIIPASFFLPMVSLFDVLSQFSLRVNTLKLKINFVFY
jgi:hypothetical protein